MIVESKHNRASESLETRRIPDPFPIHFNSQRKLILSYTDQVIESAIETDTYLGRAELEGFLKLQKWLYDNQLGEIAWLSPPYADVYKTPKIVVYNSRFGVATVLDNLTPENCIHYARDLGLHATSLEEIRVNPIPLNGKDWLGLLENYMDTSKEKTMINSGFYLKEKERAITAPTFGNFQLRCAGRMQTAHQILFENANFIGPTFDCPKCDGKIPSGKGITVCPHCGARKDDFGNKCD